jgi:hypothetical protein
MNHPARVHRSRFFAYEAGAKTTVFANGLVDYAGLLRMRFSNAVVKIEQTWPSQAAGCANDFAGASAPFAEPPLGVRAIPVKSGNPAGLAM